MKMEAPEINDYNKNTMSFLHSNDERLLSANEVEANAAAVASPITADGSTTWSILIELASHILLFLLIFGMSGTVDIDHLMKQLHNKFAILTGVGMQFLIMPLLGYIAVISLRGEGLTKAMGVTLLIVTSSPGGSYSNWWCSLFNADLALSVAMTALSTLLSALLLPANLMLYAHLAYGGKEVLEAIDFTGLFISIGIVVAAIAAGLYASYALKSDRARKIFNHFGSISGVLLIVFNAAVSSSSDGDSANLWDQSWTFYIAVAMPCVAGLVLANSLSRLARLRKPECVTVAVECCYQNVGIATSAAISMFDDPTQRAQALCVPLFYGATEAIVLGLYCVVAWKLGWTKAPRDEKFCTVIVTSYEVENDVVSDSSIDDSEDDDDSENDTTNTQDEENNTNSMEIPTHLNSLPPPTADDHDNVRYSRTRIHSDDALSLAQLGMAPPPDHEVHNIPPVFPLETLEEEEQPPFSFWSRVRNFFIPPKPVKIKRSDQTKEFSSPHPNQNKEQNDEDFVKKKGDATVVHAVDVEVQRDRMYSQDNTVSTAASSIVSTTILQSPPPPTTFTTTVPSKYNRNQHDDDNDDHCDDDDDDDDDDFDVEIQVDYRNTTLDNDTSNPLPPLPPPSATSTSQQAQIYSSPAPTRTTTTTRTTQRQSSTISSTSLMSGTMEINPKILHDYRDNSSA